MNKNLIFITIILIGLVLVGGILLNQNINNTNPSESENLLQDDIKNKVIEESEEAEPTESGQNNDNENTAETLPQDDNQLDKSQEEAGTPTEQLETISYSLDMTNFAFTPNTITAKPGQNVKVAIESIEGNHDFVIDELDVSTLVVSTGNRTEVSFQVPSDITPGTSYEFYCSVGSHRALGMVGTFIVN